MLLLAYLGRREIPDTLENDLKFVLKKSPIFLEEIVKIAQIPRHPQQMWGWYEPTKAAIQMSQCIVQAVSTDIRKGGKTKVCHLAATLSTAVLIYMTTHCHLRACTCLSFVCIRLLLLAIVAPGEHWHKQIILHL